jgi:stress response protein SCP2
MEVQRIVKGQNIELPTEIQRLHIVLGWTDTSAERSIDASALLLRSDLRVASDADFVFYNQPASVDGSVSLAGRSITESGVEERIAIDLETVAADVTTVAIAASLDRGRFGDLDELRLVALDGNGDQIARYDITDATEESAFVFGEVYRRSGVWKLRAVGQGWASGLAGLATDFGVCVDDEPGEQPTSGLDADDEKEPVGTDYVEVVSDDGEPVDELSTVLAPPAVTPAALPAVTPAVTPARPAGRATGVRTRKPKKIVSPVVAHALAEDESWNDARLFSVAGIGAADEQEKRATSAMLATMFAVRQFGRGMVTRLGAPAGTVETFTEVPFGLGERTVIPDGVVKVARAGRVWTALLEVKTGTNQLRREQVEAYLDVARERGYDAVVTLSNEISPGAGEHPLAVDKRKLKKVALLHLSWAEVVHEARMVLTHRGIAEATQAWMLGELVRYLEHPKSGASAFDDMGAAWVPVREAVVAGSLRAGDRKAPAVAEAWLRLVRWLSLRLTADLGVSVVPVLPRRLAADPVARRQAVVTRLASDGTLEAALRIPGAVGNLAVTADVRLGQVRTSVEVAAPQEWGGSRRLGWLLKQLGESAPGDLLIEVIFAGRTETACERLADVRDKPAVLLADRPGEIKSFRLTNSIPMGLKRSGVRGAFVPSVVASVEGFYGTVVQGLRPWPSPAPKLPAGTVSEAEAVGEAIGEALAEDAATAS